MMFIDRSVSLSVNNEMDERVVVPSMTYGIETLGIEMDERRKVYVIEFKWSRYMCGVTKMDRRKNTEVRCRVGLRKKMIDPNG